MNLTTSPSLQTIGSLVVPEQYLFGSNFSPKSLLYDHCPWKSKRVLETKCIVVQSAIGYPAIKGPLCPSSSWMTATYIVRLFVHKALMILWQYFRAEILGKGKMEKEYFHQFSLWHFLLDLLNLFFLVPRQFIHGIHQHMLFKVNFYATSPGTCLRHLLKLIIKLYYMCIIYVLKYIN